MEEYVKYYYKNKNAPNITESIGLGVVAIIKYKNKYLLEKRSDCPKWGFIGGKVKIEEDIISALRREVFEETGIEIYNYKIMGIFSDPSRRIQYIDGNVKRVVSIVFCVSIKSCKNIKISKESEELAFFTKKEIGDLEIVETHIPIYKALDKRKITIE